MLLTESRTNERQSQNVSLHGAARPSSCRRLDANRSCLDALFPCDTEAQPGGFQVIRCVQASSRFREQLGYTIGIPQGTQKVRFVSVAGVLSLAVLGCRSPVLRIWIVPIVGPRAPPMESRVNQGLTREKFVAYLGCTDDTYFGDYPFPGT